MGYKSNCPAQPVLLCETARGCPASQVPRCHAADANFIPSIPDAVLWCVHTAGLTTKSRRTSIQRSPGSSGFHVIFAGEFNFQAPPHRTLDDHEISMVGLMSRSSSLSHQSHSLAAGQSRQARSPAHLSLAAVCCPDRQLIGNGRHAGKSLRSQLLIGLIGVALQWRSCLELQDCLPLKRPMMMVRRWAPALPSRVSKPRRGPCHWDLEKSSRPPNGLGSESLPEPRFPSSMSDIISLTSTQLHIWRMGVRTG